MKDKLGLGHMNPKTFPFHDPHLDPMSFIHKVHKWRHRKTKTVMTSFIVTSINI